MYRVSNCGSVRFGAVWYCSMLGVVCSTYLLLRGAMPSRQFGAIRCGTVRYSLVRFRGLVEVRFKYGMGAV